MSMCSVLCWSWRVGSGGAGGVEPYCGGVWEAGRMREGRGHPQPPWLSDWVGVPQLGLLPLQAGRPCAAPKPRNLGEAVMPGSSGKPVRVSAASPLGAAGGRGPLFRSQGRDSVPEGGRPNGGVSEVPFPPPPCRVHALVLSLAALSA